MNQSVATKMSSTIEAKSALLSGPLHFGEGVRLPLEAALARYVIIGKSGAGKTNASAVLAEEFVRNGVPVIVFDVIGTMRGMRSNAAGDGAGLPIPILGGPQGDLPLSVLDAEPLARLVAQGLSVIFDLSEFSRDEKCEFVAAFLPVFKAHVQCVMHVIFEEAETFAPRTMRSEAHGAAYVATTVFARECRNASIGWTFSTQRPQLLAHDVIDSSNVFVAMLMTGDDTSKAIGAEAKTRIGPSRARQILSELGTMHKGEAVLIGESGWLGDEDAENSPVHFRFRLRDTFESAYRLKVGERRKEPSVRAEVDVEPFRAALQIESIERLDRDADIDDDDLEGEVPVGGRGNRTLRSDVVDEQLADLLGRVADLEVTLRRARMQAVPSAREGHALDAGECSRRIVLALLSQLPKKHTPRAELASLCELPAPCDGFHQALEGLRAAGWVEMTRGRYGGVSLTQSGLETLEPLDRLWDAISDGTPVSTLAVA